MWLQNISYIIIPKYDRLLPMLAVLSRGDVTLPHNTQPDLCPCNLFDFESRNWNIGFNEKHILGIKKYFIKETLFHKLSNVPLYIIVLERGKPEESSVLAVKFMEVINMLV